MLVSGNPHQATSMLWPAFDRSSICQSDSDDYQPIVRWAQFWHTALSPCCNESNNEKRTEKSGDSNIEIFFFFPSLVSSLSIIPPRP